MSKSARLLGYRELMPIFAKNFAMRKLVLYTLLAATTAAALNGQPDPVMQSLKTDLVYLSSDYLGGRETGTGHEQTAADYLANRFREIGLKPAGENGTWYQAFDFNYNTNPHAQGGEPRTGHNVIGYLDNNAERTVIIGAHFDHLGMGKFSSLYTGEPAIHNGADDNASGVAAMIRIAAYLAQGKAKGNNYLFIGFSGEELGLIGSKYFTNHPTIDLAKANYMINMDMVGRLKEEKVLAINGAGTSPAWKPVLDKISVDGISAKTSDSGVGPSDHTSFYLKDIPVLHFFTGQHGEYHKPADDAALINFPGLLSVSNYIIAVIEQLDKAGKLEFTKTKDEEEEGGKRASRFKVTLGVMPDYVGQVEGMRVDAVTEGKPAAKAGMKSGDVIIKIGDTPVKDIYGYMEGLGKYNPGDKTKVVVKRGSEEMTFDVVFD